MKAVVVLIAVLISSALAVAQDTSASTPSPPSQASPSGDSPACKAGDGVRPPRIILAPAPKLKEEEKKNDKDNDKRVAVISLTVSPEGKPKDIKVVKSLGAELDKKAIEAVNTWRFDPATRDCKPVAVQISVEVTFALY
ncbi:MAG: energy transducer TonB [Terriglobales bacterium]|jgi:TonB family protein